MLQLLETVIRMLCCCCNCCCCFCNFWPANGALAPLTLSLLASVTRIEGDRFAVGLLLFKDEIPCVTGISTHSTTALVYFSD